MKLTGSKTISFPCPILESFEVDVAYVDIRERRRLIKACTVKKLNPQTRQFEETVDAPRFLAEYLRKLVPSARGLTVDVLQRLVVLHEDETLDVPEPGTDGAIPWDHDAIVYVDPEDAKLQMSLPVFLFDRVERARFAQLVEDFHAQLLEFKAIEDEQKKRSSKSSSPMSPTP